MIISFNRYNGGGGSSSAVTPEQVQQQINSALTPYWESGETKDYVDGAVSGISLDGYYTSAQTQSAITAALEDLDLSNYATSGDMQSAFTLIQETQQVAAAGLNQLEGRIDELSGSSVDMSAYYTSAQTENAITSKNYVTSAQVETQILEKNYVASAQVETQIDTKAAAYTPTSGFATINGSAITNGGNITVADPDMSEYWTSAETKAQIDELADELSEVELVASTSINDIKDNMVSSAYINTIWRGSQSEYDTLVLNNQIDNNTLYVIL